MLLRNTFRTRVCQKVVQFPHRDTRQVSHILVWNCSQVSFEFRPSPFTLLCRCLTRCCGPGGTWIVGKEDRPLISSSQSRGKPRVPRDCPHLLMSAQETSEPSPAPPATASTCNHRSLKAPLYFLTSPPNPPLLPQTPSGIGFHHAWQSAPLLSSNTSHSVSRTNIFWPPWRNAITN